MVYCKGNVFFPKNQTFCPKFQSYGGVMGDNGSVTLLAWGRGRADPKWTLRTQNRPNRTCRTNQTNQTPTR